MGFRSALETGSTGIGDRAALDRDREMLEQSRRQTELLTELVAAQKHTNELLKWLGTVRPATR